MKHVHPLRNTLVAVIFLAGFLLVFPARADFHMVQIEEVHAGTGGNANIQFIEIAMSFSPGQNCQGTGDHIDPFNLFSPCDIDGLGARLVFFDAAGNQTGEFIFPGNTPDWRARTFDSHRHPAFRRLEHHTRAGLHHAGRCGAEQR